MYTVCHIGDRGVPFPFFLKNGGVPLAAAGLRFRFKPESRGGRLRLGTAAGLPQWTVAQNGRKRCQHGSSRSSTAAR